MLNVKISPDEVSEVLKEEILRFAQSIDVYDSGVVLQVGDGIARIHGLENAISGELVEFPNGVYGIALNLEEDNIGCVLLGEESLVREGDIAKRTGRRVEVPVGDELLGRVIDPLGQPLDGKGDIKTGKTLPVERRAPGVVERQPVEEPLYTGLKAIDSMIPIGKGQRELIIGDRQTGKTAIAVDTIINQRDKDVYCVYVAIGQKGSTVARIVETLRRYNAMDYTVIVVATASDPSPLQYLAPFSGTAIAEHYRDTGRHALIIYDDLTKHAWAYRQMSLLLRRPPGREAYPGDIFYLHARLLERAAKLSDELGGGSLTAFPIVETHEGDISTYIPTNIISITDGQIYLEPGLFYSGIRPAINVGISVSRVGGAAQIRAMRQVTRSLRLDLARYREVAAFAQFGTELDKATQMQLVRGERLQELLKQEQYNPMPVERQVVSLFAGTQGYLDDIPVEEIRRFERELLQFIDARNPVIFTEISSKGELDEEIESELRTAIEEFKRGFKPS